MNWRYDVTIAVNDAGRAWYRVQYRGHDWSGWAESYAAASKRVGEIIEREDKNECRTR